MFYSKNEKIMMVRQIMEQNIILTLPIIFLLSFFLCLLLNFLGSKLEPKPRVMKMSKKFETYACGESLSSNKLQVNLKRFFKYMVAFMVFDISFLFLVLSFNTGPIYPILFSIIIMLSLVSLFPFRRERKSA